MPQTIEISDGGATDEQLDELADQFLRLRASRSRLPTLVFEAEDQPTETYQRTSNGILLFGGVMVKDREGVRNCLASLLTKRGKVTIGLVEGSSAREY